MRFMMLIKSDANAEAGVMPGENAHRGDGQVQRRAREGGRAARGRGAASDLEGRAHPVLRGRRTVIDGPFAEAKELIAGFWMIQVKSRDEAIQWALRVPFESGDATARDGVGEIELRQIFEEADFPPELVAKIVN